MLSNFADRLKTGLESGVQDSKKSKKGPISASIVGGRGNKSITKGHSAAIQRRLAAKK